MKEKKLFEFEHEAMNSNLFIKIYHEDERYARSAALDCFARLDYIESLLSIHITDSEADIINNMPVGGVFKLASETADCIVQACNAAAITDGAVDVCMGDYFLKNKKTPGFGLIENPSRLELEVDYENLLVRKNTAGRLDFGAVGKGFGVDEMALLLKDPWEIENAFLGFTSTVYALGCNADKKWSVDLGDGFFVDIEPDTAAACSGTAVQGAHICDGRTGKAVENPPFRVWAFAASAAESDAMSTAFSILPRGRIEQICRDYGLRAAVQSTPDSKIEWIWK